MILFGREIQALLGSITIQEHYPFLHAVKPALSPQEQACVDTATEKLRAARATIRPTLPRETPGWLALLHSAEAPVELAEEERAMLAKVSAACLLELRTDGDLSAFVGGVGLDALRSAHAKVLGALPSRPSSPG